MEPKQNRVAHIYVHIIIIIVSENCSLSFEPDGGVDSVGKCLLRVTIHYCGKFIQFMP